MNPMLGIAGGLAAGAIGGVLIANALGEYFDDIIAVFQLRNRPATNILLTRS